MPQVITFSNGSSTTYTYAADGTKLAVKHQVGSASTVTTSYCGNVIYENGVQKLLLTEEGYVDLTNSTYHYYLKDHQGNNRVVINGSGAVKETNHYYPFGGLFAGTSVQPFKYNGKEFDSKNGLNWYDYGARHYDATLGRWHVVDPLADKYYGYSPYAYCNNNPIIRVDKDGRFWDTVWDALNVVYDVVAATVNHIAGNHEQAKEHWKDAAADGLAMAIPGLPAGTSKFVKVVDKGVDAAKVADGAKIVDTANDATKNRVKLRKTTKDAIKNDAIKTEDGRFIDPNTNTPIEPGQEVFGHKSGQEWSKYKKDPKNQNKTRKEVIEDQNNPNIYQIEDRISNASHKYEEKNLKR